MRTKHRILIAVVAMAIVSIRLFGATHLTGTDKIQFSNANGTAKDATAQDVADFITAVGAGGGGSGGGTAGSVINTTGATAGTPLVLSGTNPTNAVPSYTSDGPVVSQTASFTISYTDDRTFFIVNSATNCVATFSDGATNGFVVSFKVLGAGSVILTNAAAKTFDTLTSVTLPTSTVSSWKADGSNYRGRHSSPKNLVGGNMVFASPSDGSTGLMAPRVLVAADIPAAARIVAPVTITQNNTNLVVDFAAGGFQLTTATNDLFIISSNIVAGASILLDITAGTTNRNITFNTGTNWMCATPTLVSSNHIMWVSLTATSTTTNSIRNSATQSYQ